MIELVTRPGAIQDDGGESEGGIFSLISSIDWRYQVWKAGVTVTDNPFLYQLWYFVFSLLGNYNYFFFAAHLLDVAVGVAALRIILEAITHNGNIMILFQPFLEEYLKTLCSGFFQASNWC